MRRIKHLWRALWFVAFLFLVVVLSSCSVLGDKRVAAGCQVADGITTYIALEKGATELNPLLAGVSPLGILAIKLLFAYIVYKSFPPVEKSTSGTKVLVGAVSLLGCVPAINNYNVIQGMP